MSSDTTNILESFSASAAAHAHDPSATKLAPAVQLEIESFLQHQQANLDRVRDLAGRTRQLQSALSLAEEKNTQLQGILTDTIALEKEVDQLRSQVEQYEQRFRDLESAPVADEAVSQEPEDSRKEKARHQERVKELTDHLRLKTAELEKAQKALQPLLEENAQLKTLIDKNGKDISAGKAEISRLRLELDEASQKLSELGDGGEAKQAKKTHVQTQKNLLTALGSVSNLTSANEALSDQVASLQKQLETTERQRQERSDQYNKLTTQLQLGAPEIFSNLSDTLETHSLQPKQRLDELNQLRRERERTAQENAQLKAELASMKQKIAKLEQNESPKRRSSLS